MHHFVSLLFELIWISFISSTSAGELSREKYQLNITAELGKNVTLPCRAPDNKPVIAVEWDRTDLGSEYVLLYRNNHYDLENQHPSFKNRVDLQEGKIKTGDVSLVVKNLLTEDGGTYECLVVQTETNRRKTVLYINLDVVPPPGEPDDKNKDGLGLIVGLVVAAIFVAIIVLFICKILKKHKSTSNRPPGAVAGTEQCLMPPVSSA